MSFQGLSQLSFHDPLIGFGLAGLYLLLLPLGALHVLRIFLALTALVIREFKAELNQIRRVAAHVWVELTSWKT